MEIMGTLRHCGICQCEFLVMVDCFEYKVATNYCQNELLRRVSQNVRLVLCTYSTHDIGEQGGGRWHSVSRDHLLLLSQVDDVPPKVSYNIADGDKDDVGRDDRPRPP